MASEKEASPQPSERTERLHEAGNVEKRGGWQKPTVQPTAAMTQIQQGMPDKPQGAQGGQSGGQSQDNGQ